MRVVFRRKVKRLRVRSILVSQSIQTPLQPVDPGRISIRILIAVIAVIPVKNIKTPVRPSLLHDRHEPRIMSTQQIRLRGCLICGEISRNRITVKATAVDIPHVELAPVLLRIRITVVPMNAAVRRFLMFMPDDTFDLPSERWVWASLTMIIAGFRQMPQVINHTRADECITFVIKRNPPWITRAFAEHLKLVRLRMNAKHRTREIPRQLTILEIRILRSVGHMRWIENSVQTIKPAVRSPCQRIG